MPQELTSTHLNGGVLAASQRISLAKQRILAIEAKRCMETKKNKSIGYQERINASRFSCERDAKGPEFSSGGSRAVS
jgi:hypothetical protein